MKQQSVTVVFIKINGELRAGTIDHLNEEKQKFVKKRIQVKKGYVLRVLPFMQKHLKKAKLRGEILSLYVIDKLLYDWLRVQIPNEKEPKIVFRGLTKRG